MATNQIKTRILNKYDLIDNYNSATSFYPLKGEICIAEIPTDTSNSGLTPPAIGIKIGTWDGGENNTKKTFAELPWIQAIAGDIPVELKTAAGIDAQVAALASNRKLATVAELSSLGTKIGDTSIFTGNDVSTAIKDLQAAVGTNADGLAAKVETLENVLPVGDFSSINTVKKAIETAEGHIGTVGNLTTAAKTSTVAAINELDKEIGTIANLNNKKTTLVEEINAVDARVTEFSSSLTTVSGQVGTLIGSDTEKSVRAIATAVLTEELIPEGAADSLNTLEEIAQWIQDHPGDAAAMNARLEELKTALGGTGSVADGYTITPVSNQIDTKINTYNTNTVAKTYATIANLQKVSEDLAEVKTTANGAVQEVVTGSTNGTISVDGTEVVVKGLGTAAYTAADAYATATQGEKAETAVQSASFAGTAMTKSGTALTISQTDARTALGLGSAAYKETSEFAASEVGEDFAAFKTAFIGSDVADGNGLIKTITYNENGSVTTARRAIKPADISTADTDVFVFYCGTATDLIASI